MNYGQGMPDEGETGATSKKWHNVTTLGMSETISVPE